MRLDGDGPAARQPWRIVVDSTCRTPPTARVVTDAFAGRTLVITTPLAPAARQVALQAGGAEVVTVAAGADGRVDLGALMDLLAGRGIINVLAEAGGTLTASLFAAEAVDKVYAFLAPKIVGGADAPGPVGGTGVATMDEAFPLRLTSVERLGKDVLLVGYTRGAEGD